MDNHKNLSVERGDTVVLSARIIPGNEKGIYRMINHFAKRGADVIYGSMNPPVHVSGHGSAEELRLVLNLVRPRYFLPIHGEYRQMAKHAALASHLRGAGLEETFMLETGETLEIDRAGARRGEKVQVGRVCIDSGTIDEVVEDIVIRDRRHLSEDGFVLPIIAISKNSGRNETLPEIVSRGFMSFEDGSELLQEARQVVARTLEIVERRGADRLGRDAGKDPRGSEALPEQRDLAPAVDHAGDSGSVARARSRSGIQKSEDRGIQRRQEHRGMVELEDASGFRGEAERVVTPASEAELLEIIAAASREDIPLTIVGARTGLTGGCVPQGGWAVSLEKFRRLEICPGRAIAGAGVSLDALQAEAARTGQFYAPDPTERTASIGGTIATNASGSRSFRYGSTRRHILRLRVALMDGRVLDVRRGDKVDFEVPELPLPNTTKNTAGYPLAPGDGLDRSVHGQRRHARNRDGSRTAIAARARRCAGGHRVPDQRWRRSGCGGRLAAHPGPSHDRVLRCQFARFSAAPLPGNSGPRRGGAADRAGRRRYRFLGRSRA